MIHFSLARNRLFDDKIGNKLARNTIAREGGKYFPTCFAHDQKELVN
jgi:hypothetical protein